SLGASLVDDLPLAARHYHVVLAERDAGLEGVVETERHDPVTEDHRLLLSAVAVDLIDHARDFPLGHELVHGLEGDLRIAREHVAKHHPAGGGLEPAPDRLSLLVDAFPPVLYLSVQADRLLLQRVLDLAEVVIETAYDVLLLGIALELLLGMQLELPLPRIA